jgi:uncharacterized protein YcbX
MNLKVERLSVYPVKSCGGIDLASATVEDRGFRFDRSWIVVDADGKMVTQRQHPALALIHPEVTSEYLIVRAANIAALKVPLAIDGKESLDVAVWGRPCRGIVESEQANNWFSSVLDKPVKLVRFDPEYLSKIDPMWAGETGAHTAFADALPFHITSVESLAALNEARKERGLPPTQMDRFRPNIVLSGDSAWAEDRWPAVGSAGGVKLEIVRATTRCTITETDQAAGRYEQAHGNNATLIKMGRRFAGRDGRPGTVFGVQALATSGVGLELRVGEVLAVTELSPALPPLPRFTVEDKKR